VLKLVYGCLIFSLIAGVIIFISAAEQGRSFRGMTKTMGDAILENAVVLDADRKGAITQTGNGRVVGFNRDLSKAWTTEFDPFEEGPSNPYGAGAIKSFAWCTMGCPNAILEIDRAFTAQGSAGEELASGLTAMGLDEKSVLVIHGVNSALVATESVDPGQTRLFSIVNEDSTELPIVNPTTASVDNADATSHAIIGSARGRTGILTRMIQGAKWEIKSPAIREPDLRNACISADGDSIGLISTHVKRAEFTKEPGDALGPEVTGGICTVDAKGITAAYTPVTNPGSLEAARYNAAGKRLWHHTFGAQRLISKSGGTVLVAQSQTGNVTAIDAVTGRTVFSQAVSGRPFVAKDGSIVIAGRDGEPRWLLVGKSPTN
jgi:hypothetical protein